MAKSMRSKREKRLRAIRREIVEPFYQKKDDAKMAAIEAALAAPKLPVSASMQLEEQVPASNPTTATIDLNSMEVEMDDSDESKTKASLRASGGIGKKLKRKLKLAKKKRRSGGKGKIRGKRNL
ncbi:hypothetical protein V6N13_121152 [Hibiscus sabdariffa]|uniref:Uncharacterized protein n=1 Tax=Hibiscus sabdariffa TaxID=183260 RepID=A0ABR2E6F3_9ROSI